jgi:hypothetical protein
MFLCPKRTQTRGNLLSPTPINESVPAAYALGQLCACLFQVLRNHAPHLGADLCITELTANHILSY